MITQDNKFDASPTKLGLTSNHSILLLLKFTLSPDAISKQRNTTLINQIFSHDA